jgi:hypothetical protein
MKKNYYSTAPKSNMANPIGIKKIIQAIKKLHSEDPKDGYSTQFIVESKPRGPSYYQPYLNNPSESLWIEREINFDITGPPCLFPNGEVWINEDSGEEMSGLKEWPAVDSYVLGNLDREGIDTLAWYRSFHYEPIKKWGIYILDRGIYYLAKKFESQYDLSEITPETRQECIHDAVNLLYYHELFHFYTDLAGANLEILESRSMYVDYFRNRYPDGWLTADGAPADIPAKLEEALANEFSRSKTTTNRTQQYKDTLTAFMKSQPSGYAQWDAVKHHKKWSLGLSKLGERLLNPNEPLPQYIHVKALQDAIHRSYERQVPVYIVDTIPSDIYRFTPMTVFDKITIPGVIHKVLENKKTPPDVRKQFLKQINTLQLKGNIRSHRRLNKSNRKNWFFWDVTGGWRTCLVQAVKGEWIVNFLGNHDEYMRYRRKESI